MGLWGFRDPESYRGSIGANGAEHSLCWTHLGRGVRADAGLKHSAEALREQPLDVRVQCAPAV